MNAIQVISLGGNEQKIDVPGVGNIHLKEIKEPDGIK
jgi:hypothetical protein